MKRLELKCWCIWLASLLFLLFITSCKSRDVKKSSSSDQVEIKTESETVDQVTDKSQDNSKSDMSLESEKKATETVSSSSLKLTPVDKEKPIIVKDPDGKETAIFNAIVETGTTSGKKESQERTKEAISSEASTRNDLSKKSKSSSRGKIRARSEALSKESESEPLPSFWWLIPLIIVAIIARFIYKKIKENGKSFN